MQLHAMPCAMHHAHPLHPSGPRRAAGAAEWQRPRPRAEGWDGMLAVGSERGGGQDEDAAATDEDAGG